MAGQSGKSSNASKKKNSKDFLVWLFVCAKLTGVGLNVCGHGEKAESYPGRWVLSHSSLVKKVTLAL